MKTLLASGIGLALWTGVATLPAAQIGDPAAPLNIATWVKGKPVDLAEAKGRKIVVVEFWATWCGPCRVSIPHLTELQKKFADRGVVFVGVSDEDAATVKPFVDQMGDQMNYTVAVDNNRQTSQGYMDAYNQNGIPTAFVVDRDGKVAWLGHPMGDLEKVLDKLAAAPVVDDPAAQKRVTARRKLQEFTALAARGDDAAKLDALATELTTLDRELGGIEPGQKLNLPDLRRTVRFQSLMREYQRSVAAGKPATELARIEQEAAPLAPPGFKFADYRDKFSLQRTWQDYYRAVTGHGDAAKVDELTRKLELMESDDTDALNEIAWTLLTDANIKTRNLKLALKFAQAATDASKGQNADVLDTYARALFDNGRAAAAVTQEQRAVALTTDKARLAELKAALQRYQAGATVDRPKTVAGAE
ncbi:MAG TPA: TlpA disulfide reductase family protein [Verrucomicrobiae bacterium]|nr:TlpA disulfide reductase family protein [Verrucomicrobiae bacterium]